LAYPGGYCAVSKWTKPKTQENKATPATEDSNDNDDASFGPGDILLHEHVKDVVNKVEFFADKCGVGEKLRAALVRAAELHDLGKWDERFQTMLDPQRDPRLPPLGKSKSPDSPAGRRVRRKYAGYPANARHELWSVALVDAGQLIAGGEVSDLIRYLIGTHHGHGRPLAPFWEDTETVTARNNGSAITAEDVTQFMAFGSGWVDTFWALNRRYGYWGLAYLEAILRRADCVASKEEEQARE
jgi:CRISPR-associated endonuclease/helicase Cas3